MKLLISFVNSVLSLGGFDWERGELFWHLSGERLRACGICYHGQDLLVSSDDLVVRLTANGTSTARLPGPFPGLAHSIHPFDFDRFGVADTGNSAVRVFRRDGRLLETHAPLAAWPAPPADAIHLNDFTLTPHGIIASAFDYRPWRAAREGVAWDDWCRGGYGVLIQLTGAQGTRGRIVACGLNHPHSLLSVEDRLYHCSSATGTFHCWRWNALGGLQPVNTWTITHDHFLRGACHCDNRWYLGGSTARHGEILCNQMAVYRFNEQTERLEHRLIPLPGEIYDLLPWRDDVMAPILHRLDAL